MNSTQSAEVQPVKRSETTLISAITLLVGWPVVIFSGLVFLMGVAMSFLKSGTNDVLGLLSLLAVCGLAFAIGFVLLKIGYASCTYWICGACGNRLTDKEARVCAVCGARMG